VRCRLLSTALSWSCRRYGATGILVCLELGRLVGGPPNRARDPPLQHPGPRRPRGIFIVGSSIVAKWSALLIQLFELPGLPDHPLDHPDDPTGPFSGLLRWL
jgi:hypothetical protein